MFILKPDLIMHGMTKKERKKGDADSGVYLQI